MDVIGLSAFAHDSAACLTRDGIPIAMAEEERFNREKHSERFPRGALDYCLEAGGTKLPEVDEVALSWNPWFRIHLRFLSALRHFPSSLAFTGYHRKKWSRLVFLRRLLARHYGKGRYRFRFIRHHLTHAASAFYPSPHDRAAILSVDAAGEWATAIYAMGEGNRIRVLGEIPYPHSLGFAYGAITQLLGFRLCSDEGKVMGLAPYGKPRHRALFRRIISFDPSATIASGRGLRLDLGYFQHHLGRAYYPSPKLLAELGPARREDEPLDERHADIAAGIQERCEEVVMLMAEKLYGETNLPALCLAGGVSLNSVANGKILDRGPFQDLFVQPAANDAGGALGAALYITHAIHDQRRRFVLRHAYYGPGFSPEEIAAALAGSGLPSSRCDPAAAAARLLADGKIVAWFQGRMEWGPRALGNRSILADPRRADMKETLNRRVKHREAFRPFAPVVPIEQARDYFASDYPNPFMLLVTSVKPDQRSVLPAITHEDGTARLQTVDRETNPLFHRLLGEFGRITGVPVLLNTSFNVMGQPIVCTPAEALDCFRSTGIDQLVIGDQLVWKEGRSPIENRQYETADEA